jgi:glycosyltransferase involved in cell wall biosynthesis
MKSLAVLITVYNRSEFLLELCVRLNKFVLTSEYVSTLVFLDDCSTDDSFEILNDFNFVQAQKVVIKRNKTNLGQFKTRNAIVSMVDSDYIKFIDSDDLPYQNTITDFIDCYGSFPDADMYISASKPHFAEPFPFIYSRALFIDGFLSSDWIAEGPSSWFVRRSFFNDIGKFNNDGKVNEDVLFAIKAYFMGQIVIMKPSNIWYRRHSGQEMEIGLRRNEYDKFEYQLLRAFNYYTDNEYKRVLLNHKYLQFFKLLFKLNFRKALYFFQTITKL